MSSVNRAPANRLQDVLEPRPELLRALRQQLREQVAHLARRELRHALRRQAHEGIAAVRRPLPGAERCHGTTGRSPGQVIAHDGMMRKSSGSHTSEAHFASMALKSRMHLLEVLRVHGRRPLYNIGTGVWVTGGAQQSPFCSMNDNDDVWATCVSSSFRYACVWSAAVVVTMLLLKQGSVTGATQVIPVQKLNG
jgi:hypothetical protein